MTDADAVAPERIAMLMAPVVDRLRLAISKHYRDWTTGYIAALGVSPAAGNILGNLRNLTPGRAVDRSAVVAVYTYDDPEKISAGLDDIVGAGLLTDDSGRLLLTARGAEVVADIQTEGARIVNEMWKGHDARIAGLVAIASPAVVAAAADGGPTFEVMAPADRSPGAADGRTLSELLTGLRFHRYDAHIAAWRAAGLDVAGIKAMASGPERDAIEDDTNRRAATPYAALEPVERVMLLGGLAALPG
jgi:hypothetical protein